MRSGAQTNKQTHTQANTQTRKHTNAFKQMYIQAATQAGKHTVRPADGDTDISAGRQKETNTETSVFVM